jgi:FKBP-type peptidyl-prolyl cis-trans isomerase
MKNNKFLWVFIFLLVVGGLVYITINKKSEKIVEEQKVEQIAKSGDIVSMNYTGRLEDGRVFDSNVDPNFGHVEPFKFVLGAGMVIPGWEKGIAGMKVGEKKTLTIPAEDGYGAQGIKNPATGEVIIPPNATLIFDVELLAIINENK